MTRSARRVLRRQILFPVLLICLCLAGTCCVSAATRPSKVKNVAVKILSLSKHRVTWTPVSNADGYIVVGWNDMSGATKYLTATRVSGARKKKAYIYGRRANAVYEYRVYAYKLVNGKTVLSKISDPVCFINILSKPEDTSTARKTMAKKTTTPLINPSKYEKFYRIFGYVPKKEINRRYPGGLYPTADKAEPNMTQVTVRVWDFVSGTSGTKTTRYYTISVHKKLAATIKTIFEAIYRNPDHFPIHSLGGYRTPESHYEHNTGTALDINWNENYQIRGGVVLCGSLYKPGVNPYSIPTDGIVAKIFEKYGFKQGLWSSSQDYMHFSYFHT